MKQTLQLKLGQSLTMTPQLQQAIRLLQLSALDLQQEVQQTLETNPLLEMEEFEAGEDSGDAADSDNSDVDSGNGDDYDGADAGADEGTVDEAVVEDAGLNELDGAEDSVPEELPVDTSWDDLYQEHTPSAPAAPSDGEDRDFTEINAAGESLYDSLIWQLNLLPISDRDKVIAQMIIESIDADGMLTTSIDDIVASLNANGSDDDLVEADEVIAVLKLIQQFEPTGIGARDLRECLLLQLQQLDPDTEHLDHACSLLSEHMDVLAAQDFNQLKRATKLSQDDLTAAVLLIQTLNPRPGASVSDESTDYIVPDVIVRKNKDRWLVELNPETTPKLRINQTYAGMIKRADNSADNNYLKDNLTEARWFLKSLQSRNETLLKVATKIVEIQRGFFEYGEEAMKPLVLNEIAEAVEMHESTISRVTSRKYMHTPRGIFELKYFFSSHVGTTTGGEVSSTAIRALIKKLTSEENARKPLSDNKITAILKEQNINVARRTVAKYRESMGIPPSNERKRLV